MFEECSSLNSITCLAEQNINSKNISSWMARVSGTGTFIKSVNTTWPTGIDGIPSGWTVQDYVTPEPQTPHAPDASNSGSGSGSDIPPEVTPV
jgi:hypothetical protein